MLSDMLKQADKPIMNAYSRFEMTFTVQMLDEETGKLETYSEMYGSEVMDAPNNRARIDGEIYQGHTVHFSEVMDFGNNEIVYYSITDDICSVIAFPFNFDLNQLFIELQNYETSEIVDSLGMLTPDWSEEAFYVFVANPTDIDAFAQVFYTDVNTGDLRYIEYPGMKTFMRIDSYSELQAEDIDEELFTLQQCDATPMSDISW